MAGRSQKRPNRRPLFDGYQLSGFTLHDHGSEKIDKSFEALWPGRDIKSIKEYSRQQKKKISFIKELLRNYTSKGKKLYNSKAMHKINDFYQDWIKSNPDENFESFHKEFKEYNRKEKLFVNKEKINKVTDSSNKSNIEKTILDFKLNSSSNPIPELKPKPERKQKTDER